MGMSARAIRPMELLRAPPVPGETAGALKSPRIGLNRP